LCGLVAGASLAAASPSAGAQSLASGRPAGQALAGGQAIAGAQASGGAQAGTGAQAGGGTTLRLVAAQNAITLERFGNDVFVDPGVYVAAAGAPLQLDVRRASYTKPITITQVIRTPGGTRIRNLPGSVLDGFNGLRHFLSLRVTNARGKTVFSALETFCPDVFDPQRVSPASASASPYPQQCAPMDPFPVGNVWGIAKGWAVNPLEGGGPAGGVPDLKLPLGRYTVTESITSPYRQLFGIPASAATASVKVQVVKGSGGSVAHPAHGAPPATKPLPSAPSVATLAHPSQSVLPDLVPLPSWGISLTQTKATKKHRATAAVNFGATVWVGGNGPLDVQGFRSGGSPVMPAYQYFWRDGKVIGRVRAGTMGFDSLPGHNHWHFEQFAAYRLLNAAKTVAVRSNKVGFCIAPTDNVDLTLPHATWQPSSIGFGLGACGSPTALWVREMMPLGWGDTYFQSVAGQSFDVTGLPNGTYYVEVVANPEGILHETTTGDNVSLRQIILGGTPGHRTIRVPAWHGLDPGGH
jgi:hypothetical protein